MINKNMLIKKSLVFNLETEGCLLKKIAFEPHLESINKAYEDYFKNNNEFDFKILKKPRWKDKSQFKIIKMIIFTIISFKDFAIGKYDLVHVNGTNFGIFAYLASFFKCKYIFTMHSTVNRSFNDGNKYLLMLSYVLRPIIAKRAKKVFTISNFTKKEIEEAYNIKVDVIYNGLPELYIKNRLISLKKIRQKKIFISVGRMVDSKNPLKVIDIFEQAIKFYGDAFLIFIGDGKLLVNVKKYAYRKNLNNNILFIKKVPFEEMRKWYMKADYFISACEIEGFGLSALEATACGCMPILPKKGAFLEIFMKDRYLYDVNRIDNIKFFEPTLEDRKFLSEIVEKYTWYKAINQYELNYKKIIEENIR